MEYTTLYAIFHSRDRGSDEKTFTISGQEITFTRDTAFNTGLMVWAFTADNNGKAEYEEFGAVLTFFKQKWSERDSPGVYVEIVDEHELQSRANPKALSNLISEMEEADVKEWAGRNEEKGSAFFIRVLSGVSRHPSQTKKLKLLRDKIAQLRQEEMQEAQLSGKEAQNEQPAAAPATPPDEGDSPPSYQDDYEGWVAFYAEKLKEGESRKELEKRNGNKFTKNDWNEIKLVAEASDGDDDETPPGE